MLEKYMDKKQINRHLTAYSVFHECSDRLYWEKLKRIGEFEILEVGNYFDNYKFEVLYASMYREFVTKKDRVHYETKFNDRRIALMAYTFLEAFYNDNRYLDKVIDLIWMILEETDWAAPAHQHLKESNDSLPCYNDAILDLFAVKTAEVLSFSYTVLKEKLDTVSKNITKRIETSICERVIKNYLENNDYWYMGYRTDLQKPNNWNPFINYHILLSTLTFVNNDEMKTDIIYKVLETLEKYLDTYPFDGACDEGPSYWFMAGLTVLECGELLYSATGGYINIFNEQKIINMAEYILKAHIYNNRVVNFADSSSLIKNDYSSLYKFGKIMDNEKLISLAKYMYDLNNSEIIEGFNYNSRRLCYKYEIAEELKNLKTDHKFIAEAYLDSVNLVVIRENENCEKGLYLAAKGGHNKERHNHNDVGNFIVYKDGEPFIVDSGNMVYSALTFDPKTRYTLWTNISEYHNLPKINGINQCKGAEFTASDVVYTTNDTEMVFSLDIKKAYENCEDIDKWVRTIRFDKLNHKIEITEDYSLKKAESVSLNFLTHKPVVVTDDGLSMIAKNGTELKINIDTEIFDIETETIVLDDNKLNASWGDNLYRTVLNLKNVKNSDVIKYTII